MESSWIVVRDVVELGMAFFLVHMHGVNMELLGMIGKARKGH